MNTENLEVLKRIEQHQSWFYNLIYPRRFAHSDHWVSPKQFVLAAEHFRLWFASRDPADLSSQAGLMAGGYYCVAKMAEQQVPTWFVYDLVVKALLHTQLPPLHYSEMNWPREAMLFVLPVGTCRFGDKFEAQMVAVARLKKGEPAGLPDAKERIYPSQDWISSIMVYRDVSDSEDRQFINIWSHPIDDSLIDGMSQEAIIELHKSMQVDRGAHVFHRSLALQLTLTLASRTDLVSPPRILRKAKAAGKPDIWDPPGFGRFWKPKVMTGVRTQKLPAQGGQRASPEEPFWRTGHQRLLEAKEGKPWLFTRSIWIEPVWIVPPGWSLENPV